jgi:hypothetical protein
MKTPTHIPTVSKEWPTFFSFFILFFLTQIALGQSCPTSNTFTIGGDWINVNGGFTGTIIRRTSVNTSGYVEVCIPFFSGDGEFYKNCGDGIPYNRLDTNREGITVTDRSCTQAYRFFVNAGQIIYVKAPAENGFYLRFRPATNCNFCSNPLSSGLSANLKCENFESYNTGNISPQSPDWEKWSSSAPDGVVTTAIAYETGEAPRSLRIQQSGSSRPDVVYKLGNKYISNTPVQLSFKLYIPSGKTAYYNIQARQDPPYQSGGVYGVNFTPGGFPYNKWFDVVQTFERQGSTIQLTIVVDGLAIYRGAYSDNYLGGINFFAIDNAQFYVDRICLSEGNFTCTLIGGNPRICSNELEFDKNCYRNYGVTKYVDGPCNPDPCAVYDNLSCGVLRSGSTIEQGNDFEQYDCETGTTFAASDKLYRIDSRNANGRLTVNLFTNIGHDLFLLNSCSEGEYNCFDSRVINSSMDLNYIVTPSGTIRRDEYFLSVDATSASGSFDIMWTCGALNCGSAQDIECGETVRGNNAQGENNISAVYVRGRNQYYAGNTGKELVYSFTLDAPSTVTITLDNFESSNDNFQLALLDQGSCDEYNTLAYPNKPAGQAETITQSLSAGTYYVLVDAYRGTVGKFDLTIDWNCFRPTVCDFGGAFIHKGDNFGGEFTGNDNVLSEITSSSCVTDYFGGESNLEGLLFDSYIFYYDGVDEQIDFSLGLFAEDQRGAFLFTCDCSEGLCIQHCIATTDPERGDLALTDQLPGFYYLVIVGPPEDSYGMGITPDDRCVDNAQELLCGETVESFVRDDDDYNIGNDGDNIYSECYDGYRTYSGGDDVYRFTVNGQQRVTITLESEAEMGIFLYNYICGEICVDAAENPTGGGVATIEDISLGTGNYYLVVDKATPSGPNDYLLSLDCKTDEDFSHFFIAFDEVCEVNTDATHEVTLVDIGSNVIGGEPIPLNSEIAFYYEKDPQNEAVADAQIFQGVDLAFTLYQDAGAPDPKCSYLNGEPFRIRLQKPDRDGSAGTVHRILGTFQTPQNAPDNNQFLAGKNNLLVTMTEDQTLPASYLTAIPSKLVVSPPGETLSFTVGSNIDWVITKDSTWIQLGTDAGFGTVPVTVTVDPNPYFVPRTDTLLVLGENEPLFRRVVVYQQAKCATLNAEARVEGILDCNNPTATLIGTGSTESPLVSYTWTGPNANSILSGANDLVAVVQDPGNYMLLVASNRDGCEKTITVTVTEIPDPEIVLENLTHVTCNGDQNGSIALAGKLGHGDYKFRWEDGNRDRTRNNLPGGTYQVTLTDQANCSDIRNFTIEEPTPLNIIISKTDETAFEANNGAARAIVTGGTPDYLYEWSIGIVTTTPEIKQLPPGNYGVTVTDARGCQIADDFEIEKVTCTLAITGSVTDASCRNSNDGAIQLDIQNETGAPSILWSTGATGSILQNISPGDYSVEVTDQLGCLATETFTVGFADREDPVVRTRNITIYLDANGQASITPGDIDDGSSDNCDLALNGYQLNQQDFDCNSPEVNRVTLTVTDANGRTATGQALVTVLDTIAPVFLNLPQDFTTNACLASYVEPDIEEICSLPFTLTRISGPAPGQALEEGLNVIRYQASDTKGNTRETSFTINFVPDLELQVLTTQNVTCNGAQNGRLEVEATGGDANYQYQWSDGFNGTLRENLGPGDYDLVLTDDSGCRIDQRFTIAEPPALVLNPFGIEGVSRVGANDGRLNANPSGGTPPYRYQWNTGATDRVIDQLSPGDYSVTILDQNDCPVSGTATVPDIPCNLSLSISTRNASCTNATDGTVRVTVDGAIGGATLRWSNDQEGSVLDNLGPGTYTVEVEDDEGCKLSRTVNIGFEDPIPPMVQTKSATLLLDENGLAALTPAMVDDGSTDDCGIAGRTVSQEQFDCSQLGPQTVSLTVEDVNGNSRSEVAFITVVDNLPPKFEEPANIFTNACTVFFDPPQVSDNCGVARLEQVSGLTSGSVFPEGESKVTFRAVDPSGNTSFVSFSIFFTANFALSTEAISDVRCKNGADGRIELEATGGSPGYTFEWSNGATGSLRTDLTAGIYTVVARDQSGCSAEQRFTIEEPDLLEVTPDITHVSTIGGNDGQITIGVSGGTPDYKYSWSTGDQTPTISDLSRGQYFVTVTDANGCSQERTVSVSDPNCVGLNVDFEVEDASCRHSNDGAIKLTVSGANGDPTVKWSNDAEGLTLSQLSRGSYTVTVTDVATCTLSRTFEVGFLDAIPPEAIVRDLVIYLDENGSAALSAEQVDDGSFDNCGEIRERTLDRDRFDCNDLDQSIQVKFKLTDSSNNADSALATITVLDTIAPTLQCAGNIEKSLSCEIVYPEPELSDNCLLDAGALQMTEGLPSGSTFPQGVTTVRYQATDRAGNTSTCSFEVNVTNDLQITVDTLHRINQDGQDGFINITASGGVPLYTFEWTHNGEFFSSNRNITTNVAGDYQVKITDSNGCTVDTTLMMVVGLRPAPALEKNIRVFPNPTENEVHVELNLANREPIDMQVFDQFGRRIIQLENLDPQTKRHTIDLSNQPNGLYLLKIIVGNRFAARKIILSNE